MARVHQWIGLAVVSFALSGCVAGEKYNAMKLDRDQKAMKLAQAEAELRAAQTEADMLRQQLAAINRNALDGNALSANMQQQIADLERRLADANRRYEEALRNRAEGSPLPPALDNELRQFAMANPDVVEFDSARGMVKFKSDVTFATGSADLTDKAKTAIQRFSAILNSPAAANYELIVAGHTDSTPVVNRATIERGHKDNWYLSAHRAISVSGELQRNGVSGRRIGVTGYADNRPVASNASESGRAQNRRVEVLILPTLASAPAASTSQRPAAAPARSTPSINKDTVQTESSPLYNK